jgi:hypothetical protein
MKYRLTRDVVQTLVLEVDADTPEQAVRRAREIPARHWEKCGGPGFASIDSVSEGGDGRCWGVTCDLGGAVKLLEVDDS